MPLHSVAPFDCSLFYILQEILLTLQPVPFRPSAGILFTRNAGRSHQASVADTGESYVRYAQHTDDRTLTPNRTSFLLVRPNNCSRPSRRQCLYHAGEQLAREITNSPFHRG